MRRAGASITTRLAACLPRHMQGSLGERITSFFIGGAPCLQVEEVVYSPGDRFRLQTVSGGVVHLQLGECASLSAGVCAGAAWRQKDLLTFLLCVVMLTGIIMRDFEKNNVQF
jgi:hypothetical protein